MVTDRVMKRLIRSAAVVAALVLPAAAQADAQNAPAPSGSDTIQGVIKTINGRYGLTVTDSAGGLDSVTMHQGTIINPSGLRLATGMLLVIVGHRDGSTFDATKIDVPIAEANRSDTYGD
jgi:hypothetical protein